MINKQICLATNPEGTPTPANFQTLESAVPEPMARQVLCRTRFLSLDPYMRSQIAGRHMSGAIAPGDVMRGETVSEVVKSNDPAYSRGGLVRCMGGWQQYSVHDTAELASVSAAIDPPSYALSVLGMTGLTAYAGMVLQAGVAEGDQVLIPACTGAVGSIATQLCIARGAQVVGIAGNAEKCKSAVEDLGARACINRNEEDVDARLGELFPEGVNVFFDLVGGPLLLSACQRLANYGRIVLCGLMAEYNSADRTPGPAPGLLVVKRAQLSGLVVYDYEPRRQEFINECLPLVQSGALRQREDISYGIETAPEAFCRLMRGENFGKVIVDCDAAHS